MPSKVWDKITYLFPNFNSCTVEVWKWEVIYPKLYNGCNYLYMLGLKLIHFSKRVLGLLPYVITMLFYVCILHLSICSIQNCQQVYTIVLLPFNKAFAMAVGSIRTKNTIYFCCFKCKHCKSFKTVPPVSAMVLTNATWERFWPQLRADKGQL